jgi:hypothetical protein
MGYLIDEVLSEAKALGVEVRAVPATEMDKIRERVYAVYTRGNPTSQKPLRDLLENYESHQDPDGWKLLGDLIGNQEAILFFDSSSEPAGIRFSDGYSLQRVIGECTGFVFYATSPSQDFLLCFDDHDMILAAGFMSHRLNQIIGE